jgi:arylsulfatase A-like enzyme
MATAPTSQLFADAKPAKRPNLVYVFADQLRTCSCGYAGDEMAHTPNLDRLAKRGVNFENAVSSTPVCAPYRASLFTGKYQSSNGMVINELRLSPDHECLGHVLTKAGYDTSYIGKWHLWANELGNHNLPRNGFTPPGPYRLGFDGEWYGYNFNHHYYNSPYYNDTPQTQHYKQYEPDAQTDIAIDYLRKASKSDKPFAMFVSWGPPHAPWSWHNVPPEYADMYRDKKMPLRPNYRNEPTKYGDAWQTPAPDYAQYLQQMMQVYYGQTANIDWNVGRLMDEIDKLGLAEDTIFVFTSDHGEMFGSQGYQAKLIFYEEAARIPFLMQWKGHIPEGSKTDACLDTPDIMSTLLSMMNLPVPKACEGEDLSQVALGKGGAEPEAAYLQGMGATAAWQDGTEWRAMRDKQHTFAIYRRDGKELLFDNLADPYQLNNLAEDKANDAKVAHYREKLKSWMKEQNDTFEACSWYRDRWTENRNIMRGAKGGTHDLQQLRAILEKTYGKQRGDMIMQPRPEPPPPTTNGKRSAKADVS